MVELLPWQAPPPDIDCLVSPGCECCLLRLPMTGLATEMQTGLACFEFAAESDSSERQFLVALPSVIVVLFQQSDGDWRVPNPLVLTPW